MTEDTKHVQLVARNPPVFADEVFISSRLKVSKTKRAAGFIRLQFVDMSTAQIISDITIDIVTAESLIGILKTKLEEVDKVVKSGDPKREIQKLSKQQPIKLGSKEDEASYTG